MSKLKKKQREQLSKIAIISGVIILSVIGMFQLGIVGRFFYGSFRVLIGQFPEVFFVLIIIISLLSVDKKLIKKIDSRIWWSIVLIFYVLLNTLAFPKNITLVGKGAFNDYTSQLKGIYSDFNQYAFGGVIGAAFYSFSSLLFDRIGTIIINVFISVIAFVIFMTPKRIYSGIKLINHWISRFFKGIWSFLKKLVPAKEEEPEKFETEIEQIEVVKPQTDKTGSANFINIVEEEPETKIENHQVKLDFNSKKYYPDYKLPSLDLLEGTSKTGHKASNVNSAKKRGNRVIEVLQQFGIDAELMDIHIGPSVTKFEIKPDSNVKVNRISNIQDNIMMELAVTSLRIEAPIPGRPAVGIEIPNEEMVPVRLKEIIHNSNDFFDPNNINVALGKDLMGKPVTLALNKMPHLLIAGATGSGKSVCINSIITSLLISKHPDELKLVLIDPKKVEFTPYLDIPHLLSEVVTDPTKANNALKEVVGIMEDRYEEFADKGVRNITAYNEKAKNQDDMQVMPWIVVIIDELADLMAVAGKEVETSIQRITQLARAAGIHLIVATQRPSVDVVTGVIKANIPSRIAFAVSSAVDSRTILDATGAEKLLGYGDMLYIPMGAPSSVRVQGVFVSDEEVRNVTEFVSKQAEPEYDERFDDLDDSDKTESAGANKAMEDELYEEAVELVIENQRASTSYLQTYFGIGYNRAARIINALEQQGIIGPQQGSKPRVVNYQSIHDLEQAMEVIDV